MVADKFMTFWYRSIYLVMKDQSKQRFLKQAMSDFLPGMISYLLLARLPQKDTWKETSTEYRLFQSSSILVEKYSIITLEHNLSNKDRDLQRNKFLYKELIFSN